MRCNFDQPSETGERDEHEPDHEAGRPSARRQAAGDNGGALRDQDPATGAHQERRVMPKRGLRGNDFF